MELGALILIKTWLCLGQGLYSFPGLRHDDLGQELPMGSEPVRYDDRSQQLLNCDSALLGLCVNQVEGLLSERHHYFYRRHFFLFTSFLSWIARVPEDDPKRYFRCLIHLHAGNHISLPEKTGSENRAREDERESGERRRLSRGAAEGHACRARKTSQDHQGRGARNK